MSIFAALHFKIKTWRLKRSNSSVVVFLIHSQVIIHSFNCLLATLQMGSTSLLPLPHSPFSSPRAFYSLSSCCRCFQHLPPFSLNLAPLGGGVGRKRRGERVAEGCVRGRQGEDGRGEEGWERMRASHTTKQAFTTRQPYTTISTYTTIQTYSTTQIGHADQYMPFTHVCYFTMRSENPKLSDLGLRGPPQNSHFGKYYSACS